MSITSNLKEKEIYDHCIQYAAPAYMRTLGSRLGQGGQMHNIPVRTGPDPE